MPRVSSRPSPRAVSIALAASAVVPAALAVGYAVQADWATDTWPFETGRLSNLFLAGILAAIAAATVWVSAAREWGALRASALSPLLMLTGMAAFLIGLEISGEESGLIPTALAMVLGALYAAGLIVAAAQTPLRDTRPVPQLVRASFALFALVLVVAGLALVAGADNVVPWPADEDSLVMFGLIFCAAASSYAWGAMRPVWGHVTAPLVGFLAYDVILLPPLLGHFSDVAGEQRAGLVLYVAVLAYSGALAAYYLLIRRDTRLWAGESARD
jgi:hypothetical protein